MKRQTFSHVKRRPAYPSYEGLIGEIEPLAVTTLDPTHAIDRAAMAARKAFDDKRQPVNNNVERAADRQLERIGYWGKLDAALKMTFLDCRLRREEAADHCLRSQH
jgi:hypothetical protein